MLAHAILHDRPQLNSKYLLRDVHSLEGLYFVRNRRHPVSMSMASPAKPVKICTLGESGAGKSSLIMRLTTGNFSANQVRGGSLVPLDARNSVRASRWLNKAYRMQQTTIGAAFVAWTSPDGTTRLEIWCAPGQ